MWKLALAFVVFAVAALYMLSKGGDIDMGGEKHGIDHPAEAASAPASAAASAAAPAASAVMPVASGASQ
jgi:hypothetical protein